MNEAARAPKLKDKKTLGRAPFVESPGANPASLPHPVRIDLDTDRNAYRCFLPDLTGFTSVCCEVSDR